MTRSVSIYQFVACEKRDEELSNILISMPAPANDLLIKEFSGSAFTQPCSKLHPEESIQNQSHLQMIKRATYDADLIFPDGLKNGFKIFLRINQGIGGSQLGEEMSVRVSNQWEAEACGDFHGFEVKVDHLGIKMTIFDGVEKFEMLQKVSVQRVHSWIIRVGGND